MFELDLSVITENRGLLWDGMQMTLLLTVLAIFGGIIFGTILALFRIAKIPVLAQCAAGYVNFFRSLPLILVIFWLFFLVPILVGRPVGAFTSVLVAFILFESAYYSEIIRAGINSVRPGQMAAARAIGLTYFQGMRYIVLPQGFRAMTPILLTQGIVLFQDTSLVYVVGLRDFLVSAEIVANRDQKLVEMFLFVGVVYFVICFSASMGVRFLKGRLAT